MGPRSRGPAESGAQRKEPEESESTNGAFGTMLGFPSLRNTCALVQLVIHQRNVLAMQDSPLAGVE